MTIYDNMQTAAGGFHSLECDPITRGDARKVSALPLRRLLAGLLACLSAQAIGAVHTVNSASDNSDANPGDGLCATAGSLCTLRAAIEEANAEAGADSIHFNIGGGGQVTIVATSSMPDITDETHIDGYTQPGSNANTLAVGSNAVVNIRLDGGGTVLRAISLVDASGSSVRGLAVTQFTGTGIAVNFSSGVTIAGNFLGTDAAGANLGNGAFGVLVYGGSDDVVVGGPDPADRNVVAWNHGTGVYVAGSNNVSGTVIRNNYVGTAPDGVMVGRNDDYGIRIDEGAVSTMVRGNVITSTLSAILVADGGTHQATLFENFIGVGADGAANIGGGGHGIEIRSGASGAPNNVSVPGNVIANMAGEGVRVDRGDVAHAYPSAVAIRGNAIYDNVGMGIDLSDSATAAGVGTPNANDADDLDSGANAFQNFPVPTSATTDGAGTSVDFTYDTYALGNFWVDAYSSPSCDANGHGEGRIYLGSTTVDTGGGGHVGATISGLPATTVGHFITLTATETTYLYTSEFSTCLAIAAVPGTPPAMGDVPDQSATVGSPFTMGLVPYVTETEGDAIQSYAVTGTLPSGLSLNPVSGVISGTPDTAGTWTVTVTASDDDGASNADSVRFDVAEAPPPAGSTLQFALASQTVSEGVGSVVIAVTRTGGSSGPVSVAYATEADSATSPADFAAASGTLNWADGDTAQKTFTVSIVDDAAVEGAEQFILRLTDNAPTDTATLGSPSVQTVSITDNDQGEAIQLPATGPISLVLMVLLAGLLTLPTLARREA